MCMNRRFLAAGLPLLLGVLLLACREDAPVRAQCSGDVSMGCPCPDADVGQVCGAVRSGGCACDSVLAADAAVLDAGQNPADSATFAADSGLLGPEQDAATDASCGLQTSTATIKEARPVDVIFVIDNSGSMSGEIVGVESNINDNFARIL